MDRAVAGLLFVSIAVIVYVYGRVAARERERERTATDEAWERGKDKITHRMEGGS